MKKINFLLVEDNEFDFQLCKKIIENFYHQNADITRVASVSDALAEISRTDKKYDLVLLDLNVEDSRGISTLQIFSRNCLIPVIICSGISDQKTIEQSVLNGADGYIVKGEDSSIIIDNINHALVNNEFITKRKQAAMAS